MNRPPSAEEYAIIAEIARTTYRITAQRLGKSRGWLNALVQSHKALYESLRHDKAALRDASNQIPPDTKAKIENSEGVITEVEPTPDSPAQPPTTPTPPPTAQSITQAPAPTTPPTIAPPPIVAAIVKIVKPAQKRVAVPDQPLDPPDQYALQAVQTQLETAITKLSPLYQATNPSCPSPIHQPEEILMSPGTKCLSDLTTKHPFRRKLATMVDVEDTLHCYDGKTFKVVGWSNGLNTPIGTLLLIVADDDYWQEIRDQYEGRRGVNGIDPACWEFTPLENEAYKGTPMHNHPEIQWGKRIYKGMTGRLVGYWLAPGPFLAPDRWLNTNLQVQ